MGKQGPCCHCGVTNTPLWRNGPPEKPVLCNACGSRWRTKGTLANYTPLHLRTETDSGDYRVSRVKTMSLKKKEAKPLKRKQHQDNVLFVGVSPDNHHSGFQKALVDEDISNRSSSGSAISNSESCARFGNADASDLTGPSQSVVWDTTVPSRKRTCVNRPKQSPVEKLTKDLYSILHEQQSSYFSGSSEEDLLFESDAPMVSVEIGHGSVLIRHPSTIAQDEESEASSLSLDNKLFPIDEAYSCSIALPVHIHKKGVNFSSAELEKIRKPSGAALPQDQIKREKFEHEKLQFLGNHNSSLSSVDLKDIVNFDEFGKKLSNEEQQQLLKYLPSVDTVRLSDSLKSMFNSFQFKENLFSFQQLLAEGVFDTSFSGMKTDDYKTLKQLALVNLTKSKWVEHYTSLKNCKNGSAHPVVDGGNNLKRPNDCRSKKFPVALPSTNLLKFPEGKAIMRSPRRVIAKVSCETEEDNDIDHDTSCFSPSSLFAMPLDGCSFVLESIGSDQDMLLDVPSNGSFPQAELLLPPPSSSFSSTQTMVGNSSIYAHTGHP